MKTREIRVSLAERSYDIEVGAGNLSRVGQFIADRGKVTHVVIITDSNVRSPYAAEVEAAIQAAGAQTTVLEVEAGEASKSIDQCARLWTEILAAGADRKSCVAAVGGGVVGDLAGFIAATFTRGVDFYQMPTTLLAQVDSSVGGKTGVNLPGAKNMVGAFWQPQGVVIDIDSLKTLPEREYRAGLAEVVKYGVILDAEFFVQLEDSIDSINARDPETLIEIVAKCCRLKADVVENDERETTGLRAILNYGHTFCHAIEAVSGYGEWLHGEAVSIGMMCAARLALALDRVDQQFVDRQKKLLQGFGLPLETPDLPVDELIAAMQRDKKVEHGQLRFVLPTRIGHVELVGGIDPELARRAMFPER